MTKLFLLDTLDTKTVFTVDGAQVTGYSAAFAAFTAAGSGATVATGDVDLTSAFSAVASL